ncbi:MAG: nucleoside deaminase [Roseburia sp.]|nr:nucleoside deaminase [Anaeroplasma bactoclasticum]MCM1196644.1 nucleoside deaminase [Roseburia sp.]MCM1557528.1 nucleoside deaminase [Anaeroplasma bactoclasticum]
MLDEKNFMQMAIREAQNGIRKGHGGPFGAVIVKDGVIIGKGHNQVIKNNDPTCHGEIMAIHKACKTIQSFDLSGCVLYTTGEPCPMCLAAILWANISKVYYGCTIEDTAKIGFRDSIFYQFQKDEAAKSKFAKMLDREACLKLYDEYMSIENKTNY